jgi:hypothetical protein
MMHGALFALALLGSSLSGAETCQGSKAASRENAFFAVAISPNKEVAAGQNGVFWLGIKNESQDSRAICAEGVGYQIKMGEGIEGVVHSFSPHACQIAAAYHLVLPGETFFEMIEITMSESVSGKARIVLDESFVEFGTGLPPSSDPELPYAARLAVETGVTVRKTGAAGTRSPRTDGPGFRPSEISLTGGPVRGKVIAGDTATLWVGIKNETNVSRAICVVSLLSSADRSEPLPGVGESDMDESYRCKDDTARHLILPAETYYEMTRAAIPADATGATTIHLSAKVLEFPTDVRATSDQIPLSTLNLAADTELVVEGAVNP